MASAKLTATERDQVIACINDSIASYERKANAKNVDPFIKGRYQELGNDLVNLRNKIANKELEL